VLASYGSVDKMTEEDDEGAVSSEGLQSPKKQDSDRFELDDSSSIASSPPQSPRSQKERRLRRQRSNRAQEDTPDGDPEPSESVQSLQDSEDNEDGALNKLQQKTEGFRDAVKTPPSVRTEKQIEQIYNALHRTFKEKFFQNMDTAVHHHVCARLQHQEFKAHEKVLEYGHEGDRVYIIWSGRVQIEVPRDKVEPGKPLGAMVKRQVLDPPKIFGELAPMSADKKRKARVTTTKDTELLSISVEDWRWCLGFSQDNVVTERLAFFKAAEGGILEECLEADLQAMCNCIVEEQYIGRRRIMQQGAEVDKVIFVRNGFCKVVRKLEPRFKSTFQHYADWSEPMPNPFADGEEGLLRVGQKGVWPDRRLQSKVANKKEKGQVSKSSADELGLQFRQQLKKLLKHHEYAEDDNSEQQGRSPIGSPKSLLSRGTRRLDRNGTSGTSMSGSMIGSQRWDQDEFVHGGQDEEDVEDTVVVDILSAGSSIGVMELMDGLMSWQFSVIPSPWCDVYVISKFDFVRTVSKAIIHRLFCECKARLSDQNLVARLKQKNRWEHYKKELCEDIRNWNTSSSKGIIDRYDPPARSVGVSGLPEQDFERVGHGGKLWNERAQTPPRRDDVVKQGEEPHVKQIFRVECIVKNGKKDVTLDREERDATMDAIEEKLLKTMATARDRDKMRRKNVSLKLNQQKSERIEDANSPMPTALPSTPEDAVKLAQKEALESAQRVDESMVAADGRAPEVVNKKAGQSASGPKSKADAAGQAAKTAAGKLPPVTPRKANDLRLAKSTAIALKLGTSPRRR